MIAKIDDAIIGYLNTAYLWIWDRTGITVAMIAFPTWSVLTFLAYDRDLSVAAYCLFALVGLAFARNHYIQANGHLEVFNMLAQMWRVGFLRRGVSVLILVSFVLRLIILQDLDNVGLLMVVWMQFLCVKIRKREPPEKLVFAPQGAS